jgi:S1/P1 Nuclease
MPKKITSLLFALALLLTQTPAFAWGDTGHMVVAQIAYSRLNPTAAARVAELVKLVRANYSFKDKKTGQVKFVNKTYTPVTIANYMDDMRDDPKSKKLSSWHFTNVPFFEGIQPHELEAVAVNIQTQIQASTETLRENAFSQSKQKMLKEATNLAYLFHLIGDLHQPLHCVSRYSPEHPDGTGDQGGNLFFLDPPPDAKAQHKEKLHGYWDAGGRQFTFVSRPLSSAGFDKIREFAFAAMKTYPAKRPEWKVAEVDQWVRESHDLAVEMAYQDAEGNSLTQFVEPDDKYKMRAQEVSRRRVAMAGYRLAALLNSIYPEK